MKKILLLSLMLCGSAMAESPTIYTDQKALRGCYKENGSDLCVDITQIICTDSIEQNSELYGAIIGSFCDDINYYDRSLGAQNWQILRLKQKIKNLERRLNKGK